MSIRILNVFTVAYIDESTADWLSAGRRGIRRQVEPAQFRLHVAGLPEAQATNSLCAVVPYD